MLLLALTLVISALSFDTFGDSDVKRVGDFAAAQIDADGSVQNSLPQTYYAVDTLARLNQKVPHSSSICSFIKKANTLDVDSVFFATSIGSRVGCQISGDLASTVSATFGDTEDVSLTTLAHAVDVFVQQKLSLDDSEVDPVSTAILALADSTYESGLWADKPDQQGNLANTGLALSALSKIKLDDSTKADARKQAEAALSQETNDLKSSAYLLQGLMDFGVQVPDAFLFQTTHFLLSHKDTTSLEDIHALVVGLQAASRSQRKPVVVSVKNQVLRQAQAESVKVSVTDIWGKGIGKLGVTLLSAKQVSATTPLVTNQQFKKDSETVYGFDFFKVRPDPGTYVFTLDVIPESTEFLSVRSFTTNVRVVAKVGVTDGSISVSSKAAKEEFTLSTAPFAKGKPVTDVIQVGAEQHLFINFKLKNNVNNRAVTAQQVMVKFTNTKTQESVHFVVPQIAGSAYQLHFDAAKDATLFNSVSGTYTLELIVGDSHIDGSFRFEIGKAVLQFANAQASAPVVDVWGPLPEISHKFQPGPAHASPAISSFYTLAVLAPFGLYIIMVLSSGANFKGANSAGFLFLGCIAANFALIAYFWVALKLYQAVVLLVALSFPTAIFGKVFLSTLAAGRLKVHKD